MEQILILSGPPGAATDEVARALCERYDRMLHIPVDALRRMVVAGFRHAWAADAQAQEQHALAIRNAGHIAREAAAARYAVVIDDAAPATLAPAYRAALAGTAAPLHWVTLLPAREHCIARLAGRSVAPARALALYDRFARDAAAGDLPGCVLDVADGEAVHVIADRVARAVSTGAARFPRDAGDGEHRGDDGDRRETGARGEAPRG